MDAVPTVALITSEYALSSPIDADRELDLIVGALAERGVDGRVIDWRDPSADYSGLDLVLIKSPWDYAPRAAEFLAWLAKAEALAPVLNHPELVRWNLDKTYLAALAARGVAVCPTEFCGRIEDVQAALAAAAGQVVLKPSVSAASADTGLFDPDDRAAMRLAEQIFAQGKVVMVQPAIPSVATVGERSLIHFDAEFVHAIVKGPLLALGGGLLGGEYQETITVADAPDDERELARSALASVDSIFAGRGLPDACPPLYARVDIAREASGRPVLMELELFEPSYFLDLVPGVEHRFADAVLARLRA
jgi:hypothetical protein